MFSDGALSFLKSAIEKEPAPLRAEVAALPEQTIKVEFEGPGLAGEIAALKDRVAALEARPYFPPINNGGPIGGCAPAAPSPYFGETYALPGYWPPTVGEPPVTWMGPH